VTNLLFRRVVSVVCFATLLFLSSIAKAETDPMDWPFWRGPHGNSVSDEVGLIDEFDPKGGEGSNVLWKSEEASGISTPIVMKGRLFTITRDNPGTRKDAEKIICLDAASGKVLWENVYNVFLSDVPAERVGWSHVTGDPETNRVYALGACCLLQCIDAETGKTIWEHSLSEKFGMLSTYGGRTNTPLVFEDLVIISGVTTGWDEAARPAHRYLAFDKMTGDLVWVNSTRPFPEDTTYSTPLVRVINGQQVMIAGAGDGAVYAFQPRTGKILWTEALSRRGINTSVVVDNKGAVFAAHGEENPVGTNMGAAVRIDGASASLGSASAEVWRTEQMMIGKSSPLVVGNRLYVVEDTGELHTLDTETGEEVGESFKLGTTMRGSLVYADGKVYGCTASGIFHILKPSEDGLESVFKTRLPRGHEAGGSVIVSHGRIYLPTTSGLYCLAKPDAEPKLRPMNESEALPEERPASEDTAVAHLQLIPADAIVAAGSSLQMKVVAYNAFGQRVDLPKDLAYEVSSGGTIDSNGLFQADNSGNHVAATVNVQSGTIKGTARLRVIPAFPWKFDFANGEVPITWIGARYRHVARKVDGEPVMVKITTIPKGTRSQSWMGPTNLHDYTISADVKAVDGAVKLPDIGLIAQRYTMDMMGESQQLQIRTWTAQLRMARSVPFAWKAGTWYTLKFKAAMEDGKAVLRAKAWPRGEAEPNEWTLTADDEAPNTQGSPGLFANATNAEVIYDNITVTSN
jgi:outer membrane protein assembly factor BamB